MDRQDRERRLEEKTLRCIRCGFCLEACPTFVVTGKETESPRGRIYLVRSALERRVSWRTGVLRHLETCVGCRACEPACPSGVEYGAILEMARERLNEEEKKISLMRLKKVGLLFVLMRPRWLRLLSRFYGLWGVRGLLRALGRMYLGRYGVPFPAPEPRLSFSKNYPPPQRRVYFLEGCVMSALFPATNEATVHLLREAGCEVVRLQGCCGALALHLGYKEEGRKRARALLRQWERGVPVVTNSAGCGSAMKEYPRVFEEEGEWESRAEFFARNVYDFAEFLYKIGWRGEDVGERELVVTYQDACHLVHGQGVREDPRALISSLRNVRLVEMRDSDRCCGSGGIYNVLQPDLAWALLEGKWSAIRETGAQLVLVGNPGCVAWLKQAPEEWRRGIEVMHTALFLARWGSS